MVKVNYKNISPEMEALAAPNLEKEGRTSIGFEKQVGEYYYLNFSKLIPYKNQARRSFNEEDLQQLALTIKEHGIRQPLTVLPSESQDGYYEVVSGERRLRAASIAGITSLPCIIIKDKDKAEEISLIENIQRTDLHPVELGDAYEKILINKKYGSMTDLSIKIGKTVSSISEYSKLALLPEDIKNHLIQKNIRSKIIFRKLISAKNTQEMSEYLGLTSVNKDIIPRNIMRIYLDDHDFKIEYKPKVKLSDVQSNLLREKLMKFIETL